VMTIDNGLFKPSARLVILVVTYPTYLRGLLKFLCNTDRCSEVHKHYSDQILVNICLCY